MKSEFLFRNTQWNLSNQDTNGAEESVIVSEVSSLKEWYLGWEKGAEESVIVSEVSSLKEWYLGWEKVSSTIPTVGTVSISFHQGSETGTGIGAWGTGELSGRSCCRASIADSAAGV